MADVKAPAAGEVQWRCCSIDTLAVSDLLLSESGNVVDGGEDDECVSTLLLCSNIACGSVVNRAWAWTVSGVTAALEVVVAII